MSYYEREVKRYKEELTKAFNVPLLKSRHSISLKNFIRYVLCRTFNAIPRRQEHALFHPTASLVRAIHKYYTTPPREPNPNDPFSSLNAHVIFFMCYKLVFETLFSSAPIISWQSIARFLVIPVEELQGLMDTMDQELKQQIENLRCLFSLTNLPEDYARAVRGGLLVGRSD